MNIETSSPALALVYVFALLWILMDVRWKELSRWQRVLVPVVIVFLAVFNHFLRIYLGSETYGKLIFLTMHLPYFLLFLNVTRCGVVKMMFMILSAVVFMSPTVFVGNFFKQAVEASDLSLLIVNLITYGIMLFIAQFVFRQGFNYLLKHGNNRFFWHISLVPILYYVYLFSALNQDFSFLKSIGGYVIRLLPTIYVFVFYVLLLRNYKELDEKRKYETAEATLKQQLASAKEQLALLNSAQTQTAIYQHDMRHHLNVIGGFLSAGNPKEAEIYIKNVYADIDSITTKRFCENELVNLLCSSFSNKAEQKGIRLKVEVKLPKRLSVSDTELCAILSNGLENALQAVSGLDEALKWTEFFCGIRAGKLLIEIKNPFGGEIIMNDGLPTSDQPGHGYGCRSIRSITEQSGGICAFEAEAGVFTMRVILPLANTDETKY